MKKILLTIIIFILTLFIGVFSVNAEYNPTPYEYEAIEKKIVERGELKINDTIKNDIYIDENGQMRLDEKVGQVIFKGTETWTINTGAKNNPNTIVFSLVINNAYQSWGTITHKSTPINPINGYDIWNNDFEGTAIDGNGQIYLRINKSRLIGYDDLLTSTQKINLLKTYLQTNNLTFTYQLSVPNPKTYIIQKQDIVWLNADGGSIIQIVKPLDYIGYDNLTSYPNSATIKDFTLTNVSNSSQSKYLQITFSNTFVNFEDARNKLTGKTLTYQLNKPNLVTTIMMRLIYEDVYSNGYTDGYDTGYDGGYETGLYEGDKVGYDRGLSQSTQFNALPPNLYVKGQFTSGNAYANRLYWDTSGLLTYNQSDKYLMIQFDDFKVIDQFNIYFLDSDNNSLPVSVSYTLKGSSNPSNVKKIDGLAADWVVSSYVIDLTQYNLTTATKYKIDLITTPSPQGLWVEKINNTLNTSVSNYWSVFYGGLDNVIYENAYRKGQYDENMRSSQEVADVGYREYQRGLKEGEAKSFTNEVTKGFFPTLLIGMGGIFAIEIFPGVTIGTLAMIPIAFAVFKWFLSMFGGGK